MFSRRSLLQWIMVPFVLNKRFFTVLLHRTCSAQAFSTGAAAGNNSQLPPSLPSYIVAQSYGIFSLCSESLHEECFLSKSKLPLSVGVNP